jgi:3-hydroxyisobutyrate dehydrogenase
VVKSAPASKDYEPGFKVQLMRKDYNLAVQTAKEVGATMLLADVGLQAYTDAMNDKGCYDRDSRVVYRFIGGNEKWQ